MELDSERRLPIKPKTRLSNDKSRDSINNDIGHAMVTPIIPPLSTAKPKGQLVRTAVFSQGVKLPSTEFVARN